MVGGGENEDADRVGKGLTREAYREFPLVNYKISKNCDIFQEYYSKVLRSTKYLSRDKTAVIMSHMKLRLEKDCHYLMVQLFGSHCQESVFA